MMSVMLHLIVVISFLKLISAQSINVVIPEFSPLPINCPGLRQELVKIPVLQESEGVFSYVYGCDEIRSGNCKFPGGTMTLKKPCSLDCSCVRTKTGRYQIGQCYNTCRMPPLGSKCFVNATVNSKCCPEYYSCIPNSNSLYGSVRVEHPAPFPPYKSQRFRCIPGETLPLEACLLFLKREAIPTMQFAYGMHAICRCIAEDTFGFTTVSIPPIPDIPVQRYILIQRGEKILKQPVNAIPSTIPENNKLDRSSG